MRPSIATRGNLDLIEENYRRWEKNPESVDGSWRAFFEGFELGNTPQRNGASAVAAPEVAGARESPLQTRIDGLVYAYRTLGHTIARINPLADKRPENPLLSLRELGFSEKDLDLVPPVFSRQRKMTLREMIARSEEIYADAIGTEFSTSRIRASGIGCGTGSNRARRSIRLRSRWRLRFCGCCSNRKRSRFSSTPAMSGRSVFRSRARNR